VMRGLELNSWITGTEARSGNAKLRQCSIPHMILTPTIGCMGCGVSIRAFNLELKTLAYFGGMIIYSTHG